MKNLAISLTLTLLITNAYAGAGSGKVTQIYTHEKNNGAGVIMFTVENHSGQPSACPGPEWAFDANSDLGKAMYSLILSAAALGKSIVVQGAGDCAAWADRERPLWIRVDY